MIYTKTRAGGVDKDWFYDMKANDLTLVDKRQPIEDIDIEGVKEEQG